MSENSTFSPPTPREDAPFGYFGGADQELGNFIEGTDLVDACAPAAAMLLAEIDGVPQFASAVAYTPAQYAAALNHVQRAPLDTAASALNAVDTGRKFLPTTGACIYLDMGHIEIALPEFTRATDFVAYWHASLRVVRQAMAAANRRLPDGQRLHVLVNSSDGLGNSYGQHMNFALPRRAYDNMFHHQFLHALFLASFQVSSILFTGQGKVGAENGGEPAGFQLSARADFFATLCGPGTTHPRRPVLNLRDEPLCGRYAYDGAPHDPARLHVISLDANLAQGACFLKFGVMQIIVDLICAGWIDQRLILDDPVRAFHGFSRDLAFTRRVATLQGEQVTALELQLRFHALARRFVEAGQCRVRDAERILTLWGDTLERLQARDLAALAGRLDWVLKLSLIQSVLKRRPELSLASPEIKYLDHLYGSLDAESGLFWACQLQGRIEEIVSEREISRAGTCPPDDTRAWTRAMLLRQVQPGQVDAMDWDYMRFTFRRPYPHTRTLDMSAPLALTRAQTEARLAGASSLAECLDRLGVPGTQAHWSRANVRNNEFAASDGDAFGLHEEHHES